MEDQIQEYLILTGKIVTVCYMLPILIGIWRWSFLDKSLRLFFIYIVATFLLNALEQLFMWATRLSIHYYDLKPYLDYWEITNPMFMYILFYLKNALLLGWLYSTALASTPRISQRIGWVAVGLAAFELLSYFFIDGYKGYGNLNPTLDGIWCFALPMLYLWFMYKQTQITIPLTKNSFFWISFGLILTNLIGLLFFYTADKLYESDVVTYSIVFMIKNSTTIAAIVFYCIAFYRANYIRFIRNKPVTIS